MLRILVFLIAIVLAAAGITWLGDLKGFTSMEIGGTLIDVHSGLLIGVFVLTLLSMVVFTLIVSGLWRLPKNIERKRADGRRARGMIALTRGLEAVAAGDAQDAQRHAKSAMRQLDEPNVTRLLTAQAAQLAGDEATAQESFSAMLEAPETEFLGLRGLYLQAMNAGDRKEARLYADRAFKLRPNAEWAYQSVFALSIERGGWGDAREALIHAQQNNLEAGDNTKRKEAALLTAQAYAADAAQDSEAALREVDLALKKAPGFAPAAALAARLEGAAGRRSKAGRILDDAWSVAPHPALAKTMTDLFADESVERRAARLRRLAERAPGADESLLLLAEQDIAEENFQEALTTLEPLLLKAPRASTFAAMAAAMTGLHGRDAAQPWLDRAAAAPLDPVPGADGVFHFTRDGWQRLIREYGDHNRLAPPPLEEIITSLSREEVRLLTAPPPVIEEALSDEITPDTEQSPDETAEDITSSAPSQEAGYEAETETAPEQSEAAEIAKNEGQTRPSETLKSASN